MTVELTNHFAEMSVTYEVERIKEETYGRITYFKFYFGDGKWSREYSTPKYSYRVIIE